MSRAGDVYRGRSTYRVLNRRTVAGIQRNITKKGGRGLLSRVVHAKNDKDAIAGWKSDLNGVLQLFNVSFVGSVPLSLTSPFRPNWHLAPT